MPDLTKIAVHLRGILIMSMILRMLHSLSPPHLIFNRAKMNARPVIEFPGLLAAADTYWLSSRLTTYFKTF